MIVSRRPVRRATVGAIRGTTGDETTANHGIRYANYQAIHKLNCLTVLCWYMRTADAAQVNYPFLIAKTAGGGDEGWYEWFIGENEVDGAIYCGWGRWSGGTGSPTSIQRSATPRTTLVPHGRWAHVGFRYNANLGPTSNAPDLLLNGRSMSGQSTNRTPASTQAIEYASSTIQPIWIAGRDTAPSAGNWVVVDAAVWARYLSRAEVFRVYASGPSAVPGGLVFWPDGGLGGPGVNSGQVIARAGGPPMGRNR